MAPFTYVRAESSSAAVDLTSDGACSIFIAGGTSVVDLLKESAVSASVVVDVSRLPMSKIRASPGGGLSIGANVSNATAAAHPLVASYAAVSEAILSGASQQIRNVATMAGNPLQRTRCPYLRDTAQRCNKRQPGSGCSAISGYNRTHAIFGQSDRGADDAASCIAVHPSDLAVALAAFDAEIVVQNRLGERRIAFADLLRLPGDDPSRDTSLETGDLITAIELPAFTGASHYLKVRDRASYAYGLVSCAVALTMDGDRIGDARIALGSVAARPWRVPAAEAMLIGQRPDDDLFAKVADAMTTGARTYPMNGYKVQLARTLVWRGLAETTGLEPLAGAPGTAFAASVGGIGGLGLAA